LSLSLREFPSLEQRIQALASIRGCSRLPIMSLWGIRSSVKSMGLGWEVLAPKL